MIKERFFSSKKIIQKIFILWEDELRMEIVILKLFKKRFVKKRDILILRFKVKYSDLLWQLKDSVIPKEKIKILLRIFTESSSSLKQESLLRLTMDTIILSGYLKKKLLKKSIGKHIFLPGKSPIMD